MTATGLYIHIPFCKKKCDYCDFASIPMDGAADVNVEAGGRQPLHDYLIAINNELQSYSGFVPSTIFIGGGTPTILSDDQLIRLLEILTPLCISPLARGRCPELLRGTEGVEFSIEGNPDSITSEKLKIFKQSDINRLSIGAQSFNDDELKTLGRIHNSKQITEAFENARNEGFDNINIDLIFGIPGQTLESWKRTLDIAIKLDPEHISCYGLQIEEGTPFYENYGSGCEQKYGRNNVPPLPDDDMQYNMYKHSIDFLTSRGYHHYEISNFAKPGYECKHNINYWKNGDYLGIGASAASHIGGKRWENLRNIKEYTDHVRAIHELPQSKSTSQTEITETILMNLRLLEGMNLADFEKRFGTSFVSLYEDQLEDLISKGLAEIKSGFLRMTEKGLYLGNEIFRCFV